MNTAEFEQRVAALEMLVISLSHKDCAPRCGRCYDPELDSSATLKLVDNYDYRTGHIDWKCPRCNH